MRFGLLGLLLVFAACAAQPPAVTDLAPADFGASSAGSCTGPGGGVFATLTIAKTPGPRCLAMRPVQRLRVLSRITAPARVRVGGISFNVPPGKATLTDGGIGRYLAYGGHYVSISSYSGNTKLVVVR